MKLYLEDKWDNKRKGFAEAPPRAIEMRKEWNSEAASIVLVYFIFSCLEPFQLLSSDA